jgi:hypothetical protein
MQTIPVTDQRIEVIGALGSSPGYGGGISYRRLPDATRHQLPVMVDQIVEMPAGVRLRFRTDASMIGVHCNLTIIQFLEDDPIPAVFDLTDNGVLRDSASTISGNRAVIDRDARDDVKLTFGDPVTVTLTDGVDSERTIEIWLPQSAHTEVLHLVLPDGASLALAEPAPGRKWVHHGSSISHAMEAHGPARSWPAAAARAAGANLTNLGFGGQAQLDQFTARAIRDLDADLISIKMGINVVNADSMRRRAFVPALHGFLDTIRDGHPDTPILLVSPIYCPAHEDLHGPSIRRDGKMVGIPDKRSKNLEALTLRQIRRIECELVDVRREAGDPNLHYLDGLIMFDEADVAMMPDHLHPDGDGQELMGSRFHAAVFAPGGVFAG